MLAEQSEWLNQTIEEPLDPLLPICDPHHHLWYRTENDYPVEAFLGDISGGHRICKTVFVESGLMFRHAHGAGQEAQAHHEIGVILQLQCPFLNCLSKTNTGGRRLTVAGIGYLQFVHATGTD